jgi:hypothetical protein
MRHARDVHDIHAEYICFGGDSGGLWAPADGEALVALVRTMRPDVYAQVRRDWVSQVASASQSHTACPCMQADFAEGVAFSGSGPPLIYTLEGEHGTEAACMICSQPVGSHDLERSATQLFAEWLASQAPAAAPAAAPPAAAPPAEPRIAPSTAPPTPQRFTAAGGVVEEVAMKFGKQLGGRATYFAKHPNMHVAFSLDGAASDTTLTCYNQRNKEFYDDGGNVVAFMHGGIVLKDCGDGGLVRIAAAIVPSQAECPAPEAVDTPVPFQSHPMAVGAVVSMSCRDTTMRLLAPSAARTAFVVGAAALACERKRRDRSAS